MHPEVYFNPIPGVIGSTEDTSYGMGACPRFTARVAAAPRTRPQQQDKTNLV
jgi:hypothetical protein